MEIPELAEKVSELRRALVTIEALIIDTVEDLGRANFKHCNDPDYAGPIAEKRKLQMSSALYTVRTALE